MDNHLYLLWSFLFGTIWIIFYFIRKDLRRIMIKISFVFGLAGILSELVYIIDWWKPLTITGTSVGVEDFLIGFFTMKSILMSIFVSIRVLS